MNHKLKVLATSCLVFGALTACNADKDSAMQRERDMHRQQAADMADRSDMMRNTSNRPARDTVPDTTNNGRDMVRNTANNGRDTVATRNQDLMRDVSDKGLRKTNAREHAADSERTSYWGYNDFPRSYGYANSPETVDMPYTDMTQNVSYRGTDRTEYRHITNGTTDDSRAAGRNGTNMADRYNGQGNRNHAANVNNAGRMNDLTGYDMLGVTGAGGLYGGINRYGTPDAYNTDRVTYRNGQKTDHYGNVKYSKINQAIKREQREHDDAGYGYYGSQNYHGHMTDRAYPTRNVTMNGYNVNGDGAAAEKIENRVKRMNDVDRVEAVAYGDDVLVAVKPAQSTSAATGTLENDIRRAVEPYAKGRTVHVTVTKSMYDRVHSMSDRMRDGSMTNRMNKDMSDLFNTLRADYNGANR